MLTAELNTFLEGITSTEEAAAPISLEDLIIQGESDELEFKSSLRWDYQEEHINRKLEEVIVKSVASFANSESGTLLIGVDYEGAVLGLENDYKSLDGGDRDKFELHLRNLMNKHLGVSYVSTKLHTVFPSVGESEICKMEIEPVGEPIVLTLPDHNGQPKEHFYVRNENASQELLVAEMRNCFKVRFG